MTAYLTQLVAQIAGRAPTVRPPHRMRLYAPARGIAGEPTPEVSTEHGRAAETREQTPSLRRIVDTTALAEETEDSAADRPLQEPPTSAAPPTADGAAPAPDTIMGIDTLREIVERIVAAPPPKPPSMQPVTMASARSAAAPRPPQSARSQVAQRGDERSREPALESGSITNIHIGRVELTAIAPPPRAPAAQVKPPMSLDEYLRRRDGKAR